MDLPTEDQMIEKLQPNDEVFLNLSSNRSNFDSEKQQTIPNTFKGETFNPKSNVNVSPKKKRRPMNISPKRLLNNLSMLSTNNFPSPLQTVINGQKSPLKNNNHLIINNNKPKSPLKNNNNINISSNSQNVNNNLNVGNIPIHPDLSITFSKITESPSKLNTSSLKTNGIQNSSRIINVSTIQVK